MNYLNDYLWDDIEDPQSDCPNFYIYDQKFVDTLSFIDSLPEQLEEYDNEDE